MKTLTERISGCTKTIVAGLAVVAVTVPAVYALKKMYLREDLRKTMPQETKKRIDYTAMAYSSHNEGLDEQYLFI